MWKKKDKAPKPTRYNSDDVKLDFNDTEETLTITPGLLSPRHNKKLGPIAIPYEVIGGIKEKGMHVQIIISGRRNDITLGNATCSNPLVFQVSMKKDREKLATKITDITHAPHGYQREFTIPPIKTSAGIPLLAFGGVSLHGETVTFDGEYFPIKGAKAELTVTGGGGGLSIGRAIVGGAIAGGVGAVIGGTTGKTGTGTLTITFPDGRTITATGNAGEIDAGAKICNEISEWA